jgi:hypothetical protein
MDYFNGSLWKYSKIFLHNIFGHHKMGLVFVQLTCEIFHKWKTITKWSMVNLIISYNDLNGLSQIAKKWI